MRIKRSRAAAVLVLFAAAPASASEIVNGDRRRPTMRFDMNGNALDAHDGEIRRLGGRY